MKTSPSIPCWRAPRRRQRGVAIITALLVVVLAAGIATWLLAQQSQALTRTQRATARAQAGLYVGPTLDFARALLGEALQKSVYVSNQQPWAQGISYPIEDALAAGIAHDETAKFNLNNLVLNGRTRSEPDIALFKRLLVNLKLNPDLADAVIDWIDADSETSPAGAEDGYYLNLEAPYRAANQPLVQWQELARVRGFDRATMLRLAPFATALPTRTPINLNTAPIEVLAALLPQLSSEEIAGLVQMRETLPFQNATVEVLKARSGLQKLSTEALTALSAATSATSNYFSVSIAVNSASTQVRQLALLQRAGTSAAPPPAATPPPANSSNPAGAAIAAPPAGNGWPRIIWVQTQ